MRQEFFNKKPLNRLEQIELLFRRNTIIQFIFSTADCVTIFCRRWTVTFFIYLNVSIEWWPYYSLRHAHYVCHIDLAALQSMCLKRRLVFLNR